MRLRAARKGFFVLGTVVGAVYILVMIQKVFLGKALGDGGT